jgi:hypothetical protein
VAITSGDRPVAYAIDVPTRQLEVRAAMLASVTTAERV